MNRIFITGDTHGANDLEKLKVEHFPEQDYLTKDDYLLIAGDFGAVWNGDSKDDTIYGVNIGVGQYDPHPDLIEQLGTDRDLLDYYEKQPYTTLFIDGNHENHKLLNSYPVSLWNGGKVHIIRSVDGRPTIIHLLRGQVYQIGEKTLFTMGGADSVDKEWRKVDHTWFAEEMPSAEEYEEARKNLAARNWSVDYIITHTCSNIQMQKLASAYATGTVNGMQSDALMDFFDELETDIEFRYWFYGHHHKDAILDEKHMCIYHSILELTSEE